MPDAQPFFEKTPVPQGSRVVWRQCLACRKILVRAEMFRIVFDRQEAPRFYCIPPHQRQSVTSGRSAYLCTAEACIQAAIKGKKIQKALKTSIPDDILRYLTDWSKGT